MSYERQLTGRICERQFIQDVVYLKLLTKEHAGGNDRTNNNIRAHYNLSGSRVKS
jgi:hypothetical protein